MYAAPGIRPAKAAAAPLPLPSAFTTSVRVQPQPAVVAPLSSFGTASSSSSARPPSQVAFVSAKAAGGGPDAGDRLGPLTDEPTSVLLPEVPADFCQSWSYEEWLNCIDDRRALKAKDAQTKTNQRRQLQRERRRFGRAQRGVSNAANSTGAPAGTAQCEKEGSGNSANQNQPGEQLGAASQHPAVEAVESHRTPTERDVVADKLRTYAMEQLKAAWSVLHQEAAVQLLVWRSLFRPCPGQEGYCCALDLPGSHEVALQSAMQAALGEGSLQHPMGSAPAVQELLRRNSQAGNLLTTSVVEAAEAVLDSHALLLRRESLGQMLPVRSNPRAEISSVEGALHAGGVEDLSSSIEACALDADLENQVRVIFGLPCKPVVTQDDDDRAPLDGPAAHSLEDQRTELAPRHERTDRQSRQHLVWSGSSSTEPSILSTSSSTSARAPRRRSAKARRRHSMRRIQDFSNSDDDDSDS